MKQARIVDLATAYVTQVTSEESGKGEWILYNTDEEEIHRFPKHWDEKTVMKAIHFGRKFELIAMNAGADFEKKYQPIKMDELHKMINRLNKEKQIVINENIRISEELNRLMLGDEYEKE